MNFDFDIKLMGQLESAIRVCYTIDKQLTIHIDFDSSRVKIESKHGILLISKSQFISISLEEGQMENKLVILSIGNLQIIPILIKACRV